MKTLSRNNLQKQLLNWPRLNYHPVQYKLWVCPKRFAYVPAGRQSGKSELSFRRLVRYLRIKKPWPDPKYVYGGPTFAQAKRTAWRRLLNLIPEHWIEDIYTSELTIRTIFGSELILTGLDKPQRIEGLILDGIVIDESCDIKPGVFDLSILPMLVLRDGWAWQIGVPKRHGVGVVEYRTRFEKASRGELPSSAGFTWPSSDIIPAELLEYARATMATRDFEEQFNASFLTVSGGIFYAFDRRYNIRPCMYDPEKAILVGSDYNTNPMHWLLCHLQNDKLLVFDEIFLRNTNTQETLKVMLAKYGDHKGGWECYGDASSRGRHTSAYATDYVQLAGNLQLQAMGRSMHYMQFNIPLTDRFAATNAKLCNGAGTTGVFIDSHCTHLINDLELRSFKPGSREPDDHDDISHGTDALGYIIVQRWPLRLQIPTSNKIIITKGTT